MELNRPRRYVDVMVHPEASSRFTRDVAAAGIETSVMIEDVEDVIKRHVVRDRRSADGKLLILLSPSNLFIFSYAAPELQYFLSMLEIFSKSTH